MHQTEAEWIKQYKERKAYWVHDGNPRRPHALLASGNHSNGFFNSELVMEDPALLDRAVDDLLNSLRAEGLELNSMDRVVGPAMGAITLAHDMARQITWRRNHPCLRGYAEKQIVEGKKESMKFVRTPVSPGERLLPVEDVTTTTESVKMMIDAAVKAQCTIAPFVGVLVNRSGVTEVAGCKIVALITKPMPIWEPDQCPLCIQGSTALKPKESDNWRSLNAVY